MVSFITWFASLGICSGYRRAGVIPIGTTTDPFLEIIKGKREETVLLYDNIYKIAY
jgi:hypothetical protein